MSSENTIERESGLIFVLCGPAGSGKSSICRELLSRGMGLCLSVSTTTRKPREGEIDGVHYHFVSDAEFQRRIDAGAFIEHALFSGQRYGTEKRSIEEACRRESDLLLDIDVQGVKQLKQLYGNRVVTVFVFPPSFDTLVSRLKNRASDTPEQIALRLKTAEEELRTLSSPGFSDYLLLNDQFEQAVSEAAAVITAERMRFKRFSGFSADKVLQGAVISK